MELQIHHRRSSISSADFQELMKVNQWGPVYKNLAFSNMCLNEMLKELDTGLWRPASG